MGLIAFGMQAINPLHDPFCPLNTRLNYSVGDRRPVWHSEQIICSLHVHGTQDCSHQTDHPFATFFHLLLAKNPTSSPFIRPPKITTIASIARSSQAEQYED